MDSAQIKALHPIFLPTLVLKVFMFFMQMLSPFIVLIFLCSGAFAIQTEQAFPDKSYSHNYFDAIVYHNRKYRSIESASKAVKSSTVR